MINIIVVSIYYTLFMETGFVSISKGQRIFNLLNELNASFHKNLQNYYAKWSLTTSQFIVLALLDKHKEMKISEIANKTGFPDSNISGIVDRLENAGFVERVRCPETIC